MIRGLAAARIKAEEEKEKERVERWERAVAAQKKKTKPTQGMKPSLPSQGVGTSVAQASSSKAPVLASMSTQVNLVKERIRHEDPERTKPSGEEINSKGS